MVQHIDFFKIKERYQSNSEEKDLSFENHILAQLDIHIQNDFGHYPAQLQETTENGL